MTKNSYSEYAEFREKQAAVLDALNTSVKLFESLDSSGAVDAVRRIAQRVSQDSFKVLVLGEFKRGKSTFINALLGDEILPAYSMPCTAVINEIKWGEDKRAVLHLRDDLETDAIDRIPEALRDKLQTDDTGAFLPIQIPIENLEDFVVIPDPSKDHEASVAETPYKKVEIFWPIDLCRNGVELIDSPGLNEHRTRTSITTNYLQTADAVIFVLSCHALGGKSEIHVMDEDVRGSGHENIFIVCNRFDEIGDHERQRVIEYAQSKLVPRTAFGKSGVYFISSLDAMEGKCEGDSARVARSGLPNLESDLSRFLVEDRGRVKLMQPARELSTYIGKSVADTIPTQSRMLDQSLETLEQKYSSMKPRLIDAEEKRKAIMERIDRDRARLRDDIHRELQNRIKDLSLAIPGWLLSFEPTNTIKFVSMESATTQAASVIRECSQHAEWRLELEQSEWQRHHFQPFLQERLEEIGESIRAPLGNLLDGLDALKADLSDDDSQLIAKHEEIHPIERLLSAAGGFVIGGVGSAMLGSMLGYKEMLKSLIPAFGVTLGLMLLGFTNPLVFIGALLGAGALQGVLSSQSATRKIVETTADTLAQKLRESADEMATRMAEVVCKRTAEVADQINSGMESEIQEIRDQMASVLEEKRQGEESVAARKDELLHISQSLGSIQDQLSCFLFE